MIKSHLKITGSRLWSGSPAKLNRLFLVMLSTFPENYIKIHPQLFQLFNTHRHLHVPLCQSLINLVNKKSQGNMIIWHNTTMPGHSNLLDSWCIWSMWTCQKTLFLSIYVLFYCLSNVYNYMLSVHFVITVYYQIKPLYISNAVNSPNFSMHL